MSNWRFLQIIASFTIASLVSLRVHPKEFPLDPASFDRILLGTVLMLVFVALFELASRVWKTVVK